RPSAPSEAVRMACLGRHCLDRRSRVLPSDHGADHRDGLPDLSRSARRPRVLSWWPPVDRRRRRRAELERELPAGLLAPRRVLLRMDRRRERRVPAPHRGGELVPRDLRDVPHRSTARGTSARCARGGPRGPRALLRFVRVPGDAGDDPRHVRRARIPRAPQGDAREAAGLRDGGRPPPGRRGPDLASFGPSTGSYWDFLYQFGTTPSFAPLSLAFAVPAFLILPVARIRRKAELACFYFVVLAAILAGPVPFIRYVWLVIPFSAIAVAGAAFAALRAFLAWASVDVRARPARIA